MRTVTISESLMSDPGALSVYFAAIDELNRRYGGSDEGHRLAPEEMEPPLGVFLLARDEGHPVGGVGLRPIGSPNGRFAEVKRLWVRPDCRRDGIARRLMDELEARAHALGYEGLYLETGYAQPEALAFYPRHGWNLIDEFPEGAFSHPLATRFYKALRPN